MEKTIKYNFSKATKNTYVFTAADDASMVYYLPKSIFAAQPAEITVTIKA